jgi:hypothetical protein
MRSAEQKNDIWKAIRIMTAAPILAMASLALLWIHRRNVFSNVLQLWALIACLGLLPLMAYPLQRFIPHFKDQGRIGQRYLAMIFAVGGYILSILVCALSNASRSIWFFCLEYLLSGIIIILFNKAFQLKISGHICGVVGPMLLLIQNGLWPAFPIGCIILVLVAIASLKTNRHTIMQIVGGGVASLLAFVILSYLLGK